MRIGRQRAQARAPASPAEEHCDGEPEQPRCPGDALATAQEQRLARVDARQLAYCGVARAARFSVPRERAAVIAFLRGGIAQAEPAALFPDRAGVVAREPAEPDARAGAVAGGEAGAADPVLGAIAFGEQAFVDQLRDLPEGVGGGTFGVGAQQIEEAIFASGRHHLGRGDVRPA